MFTGLLPVGVVIGDTYVVDVPFRVDCVGIFTVQLGLSSLLSDQETSECLGVQTRRLQSLEGKKYTWTAHNLRKSILTVFIFDFISYQLYISTAH